MGKIEPDVEILELAIAREIDAYRLCMRLAEMVREPQMKEMFERLAKEELEHKARLELELMKLGVVVRSAQEIKNQAQIDDDLGQNAADMDYKDLLIFAMKKEQRSLRLYVDLAAIAKDKVTREMLLMLAEDEAMHQARFEVEYNILMRKQDSQHD
jgi:rubrerythrin